MSQPADVHHIDGRRSKKTQHKLEFRKNLEILADFESNTPIHGVAIWGLGAGRVRLPPNRVRGDVARIVLPVAIWGTRRREGEAPAEPRPRRRRAHRPAGRDSGGGAGRVRLPPNRLRGNVARDSWLGRSLALPFMPVKKQPPVHSRRSVLAVAILGAAPGG